MITESSYKPFFLRSVTYSSRAWSKLIYGDHYGISENHNNAMEKLLGEKITPAKFTDLNKPFFLRSVTYSSRAWSK
jgi:hypothetical protein